MSRGTETLAGIGERFRTRPMLALSISGVTQPSPEIDVAGSQESDGEVLAGKPTTPPVALPAAPPACRSRFGRALAGAHGTAASAPPG